MLTASHFARPGGADLSISSLSISEICAPSPSFLQELLFKTALIIFYGDDTGARVVQPELLVILVVEDDALVRGVVEEALSDGGFEPQIVSSGEEAVALFLGGNSSSFRALITDINLAGDLTGWDVAKRARELFPELPVIYMTGAAADQWPSQGVPHSVLLQKPFAPAQVVTAVSQLLNQVPPSSPAG